MRLEKRIRALEAKMHSDPVILYFADGTTREICGRADFLLRLFYAACGEGDLSPAQAEAVDLIRRSVDAQEPGGARITELHRCFLHGPAQESGNI
jgi:hypothetical protein